MPDLRELYDVSTRSVVPEPGALERQAHAQRRRTLRRRSGGYVLAATLVAAFAVIVVQVARDRGGRPAGPPSPTGSAPFALLDVASLWVEEGGSHVLSLRADGRYAIDDGGVLATDPDDSGRVTVSGDALTFVSGGSRACPEGGTWALEDVRVQTELGAARRMTGDARGGCAPPGLGTTWVNVPYLPARYPVVPLPGSGRAATAEDEVGLWVLDGGALVIQQSADGTFAIYHDGTIDGGPDEFGTWELLPGGRLRQVYQSSSPDGCPTGGVVVTEDEVIDPGVVLQTEVRNTCGFSAGRVVMVRLSPA